MNPDHGKVTSHHVPTLLLKMIKRKDVAGLLKIDSIRLVIKSAPGWARCVLGSLIWF
jgi:hypothetical protein